MSEVEGQVRDEKLDAEHEARRRLALAQVRQYPDPVLRMRRTRRDRFDEALEALVERMGRLMGEARGVGLAAPQLGILQRVLVYQKEEDGPITALVNPRLVESSEERESADEGCLSLGMATIIVPVERPVSISVEAVTPAGEDVRVDAEGLEARVIQHELDHLDGILTLDRTTDEGRKQAFVELRPR